MYLKFKETEVSNALLWRR